jgi:hypothetical protein
MILHTFCLQIDCLGLEMPLGLIVRSAKVFANMTLILPCCS